MFGGIHYSTVSKVAARIREEMLKDKGIIRTHGQA
jgi:hypothetical protein